MLLTKLAKDVQDSLSLLEHLRAAAIHHVNKDICFSHLLQCCLGTYNRKLTMIPWQTIRPHADTEKSLEVNQRQRRCSAAFLQTGRYGLDLQKRAK